MNQPAVYPEALVVAAGLGLHGHQKGSLSLDGAITAFAVGYGHLANPLRLFGVTMIGMYLLGSRATKVKAEVKAKLEDGPDPSKPSGNRTLTQVLSNSLPGLIAALLYRFGPGGQLSKRSVILSLHPIARPLMFASLGLNATILADTLASELGILSPTAPRYILSLQPVPPGTNGGVSPLGLLVSVAGGVSMGLIQVVDLLIENPASRAGGVGWALEIVGLGAALGLAGSLMDSLLGATLQITYYDTKEKRVITDTSEKYASGRTAEGVKTVGIGSNVLSNSAVNFVCGCALAGTGWYYGTL
ncbi:hypothetical protein L202_06589 [Cryptococcus amylolentus CBS 6039]|uniref:TIGR00297 family protein n=2 Tax=Cryptococcus amylolentus TaxID=104669 RepID=A0A1E3HGF9_9TREE|nr:hypothetical protein L202_06589 [Cryptococcus amylolentus CBS 6039]ODN75443.1 hypothetical protein L202_06589 [Cryptococcus amylolentus CBS 6039]ODO03171.1 TIGR00297 family protein [Cryptococcus amylolentus CBS 6273]